MKLWIRNRELTNIDHDFLVDVGSQSDWRNVIVEYRPISSILWMESPGFRPQPEVAEDIFGRHHTHERMPFIQASIYESYRDAAKRAAERLSPHTNCRKVFVYAPMRGAYPIWKAISQFLSTDGFHVYYAVTSSFVFYPADWGIRSHKGQTHSGRFANILELKRLKPILNTFDLLVYIDEIVSGSMMYAHLKEIKELNIRRHVPIIAVGIADSHGTRSEKRRAEIESMKASGLIEDFIWEGCDCLITEDNKFMLGWHYVDYAFGPNVVPVLDEHLQTPAEQLTFQKSVCSDGDMSP